MTEIVDSVETAEPAKVASSIPVPIVSTPPRTGVFVRPTGAVKRVAEMSIVKIVEEAWVWTPEREACLKMVIDGVPKAQIAAKLKVHRNTIINWAKHPEFMKRMEIDSAEMVRATRQRRLRQASAFADRNAAIYDKALKKSELNPHDPVAANQTVKWAGAFLSWRRQESEEWGDGARVDHRHLVAGRVQHEHKSEASGGSFKKLIEDGLNTIDVKTLDLTDPTTMIASLTERVLVEGTVLADIHAEDEAIEQAEADAAGGKK